MQYSVHIAALALLFAAAWPHAAAARSGCKEPSPECVLVGEWDISISLGYGERSNPVKGNSDIPLAVIPRISYYGKRFFIENLELGYTLRESDSNTLSIIAAPGYDRVFFHRNDPQNLFAAASLTGAPGSLNSLGGPAGSPLLAESASRPRHTTYLAGPEWTFNYGRFIGQVDALYEVTGEHDGYEVRAAVATPLLQSEHSLVLSTGLTWKSARLVDYYYGVDTLYRGGAAVNPFVKLSYSRQLGERWTFNLFAHYEHLAGAIADSPLLASDSVLTAFAGISFKVL